MNDDYRLTSSEYAKILGISAEALRSRRRREIETNYIQDKFGNYWWKNDRPINDAVNANDRGPKRNGLFRDPGAKKIDTRKRRRGIHSTDQETNYDNARNGWQLEELNLARRRLKLDSELKKHNFTDEEIEKIIESGKKEVVDQREKRLKESMDHDPGTLPGQPISIYGVNQVNPQYGKMLDRVDHRENTKKDRERSIKKYEYESDTKFVSKERVDMFGFKHSIKIPDFTDNSPSTFSNPYGDGMFSNDKPGSVDVDVSRSSLPSNEFGYTKPRNFTSKVDEYIWDAEQRNKNKKY